MRENAPLPGRVCWLDAKRGGTALPAKVAEKVDILKHVLMPECSILSEEEKEKLLEDYNISILQLPVISVKDPMAKAIGVKVGNILKIIRIGPPAGTTAYYRRVT